jgi:TLD
MTSGVLSSSSEIDRSGGGGDDDDMNRSSLLLRQSILERSDHLTMAEHHFLLDLCDNGNDMEIEIAMDKLLDTDVFFDTTETSRCSQSNMNHNTSASMMMDDSETTGWASDTIHLNFEQDSSIRSTKNTTPRMFHQSDSALLDLQDASSEEFRSSGSQANVLEGSVRTLDSINTTSLGSERRQSRLHERKSSIAINLWRAHESGLGVSKQASRRSIFGRSSKSSSSGSAKWNHLMGSDIFRRYNLQNEVMKTSDTAVAQPSTTASRTRRVSWNAGPTMTTAMLQQQQHRSVHQQLKVRPVVRRMRSESEGSRKSVTFHKDVLKPLRVPISERASSMPAALPPFNLPRSSSVGSLPSLHPGAPVLSPTSSTQKSVTSIPSLRLAHSVRSNSATSMLSETSDITESEYYNNYTEEKKTGDADNDQVKERKKSEWKSSFAPGQKNNTLQDAVKLLHTSDPDAPLQLAGLAVAPSSSSDQLMQHQQQQSYIPRPVMMRKASTNFYQGEGIELTDGVSTDDSDLLLPVMEDCFTVKSTTSFDDFALQMNSNRSNQNNIFRRMIRRSLSDDSSGLYLGKPLLMDNSNSLVLDVDESWNRSGIDDDDEYFDSWKVVDDEYENGYGGGGTLPFRILGTSADDLEAHPHVLSPPLMESLQAFFPVAKSSDNFWMKYSMVRDGASLHGFLQQARGSKYSILAIETVEGEVFGAFTAESWRKSWNYFGNGESFLWRMRHSRREKCHSIIDQAHMESEIDVYPFIGVNNCIQLCTHDKIAVGGGSYVSSPGFPESDLAGDVNEVQDRYKAHEWGFGLTIESDFLHGTTSPCLTFGSPSLSTMHSDGSLFEIMNIELWSLTPCTRLEDAEKLELGKLFLEAHTKS